MLAPGECHAHAYLSASIKAEPGGGQEHECLDRQCKEPAMKGIQRAFCMQAPVLVPSLLFAS